MSEQTHIAWADSTINFWSGCTKVSPGCAFCYAEARDARMLQEKVIHWGKGAPRLKSVGAVKQALAMNRKPWICDKCGQARSNQNEACCWTEENPVTSHRRRIFSLSLGDWLDDEVPVEWLAEMLDTIRQCSDVTWILCTKRPENWITRIQKCRAACHGSSGLYAWLLAWDVGATPPANIILLTSVENQAMAEKRIPELLKIPAACRGLSLEPLLGPVDLNHWIVGGGEGGLDWLICGGESGYDARICSVDWIRSLVRQGKTSGVATFVKQLGSNAREYGTFVPTRPSRISLKDKKGGDINEWPKDLQIQQWPSGF